jgi:hypothetical protein
VTQRKENREENKRYKEIYAKENGDIIKAGNKKYYHLNSKRIKNRVKDYAKNNKEKIALRNAVYLKNHPERTKEFSRRKYISYVLRPFILNRDNYTCQLCPSITSLQIHHINPKKNDNSIDNYENLITLCRECHLNKAHNGCTREMDEVVALHLKQIVSLFGYSTFL